MVNGKEQFLIRTKIVLYHPVKSNVSYPGRQGAEVEPEAIYNFSRFSTATPSSHSSVQRMGVHT